MPVLASNTGIRHAPRRPSCASTARTPRGLADRLLAFAAPDRTASGPPSGEELRARVEACHSVETGPTRC